MVKKKLFRFSRQLWLKAQIGTPPFIQKTIISPILMGKETLRLVVNPFFRVVQLQGKNSVGPLSATYIGIGASERFLRQQLFTSDVTRKRMKRIPFWQCQSLMNRLDSDIVIVEAGKEFIDKLPAQKAIIMPPSVQFVLDIRGTWDEVKARFHDTVIRNEFRLAYKRNYTFRVSHNLSDFEHFYHQMYLPTMQERHGEYQSVMAEDEAAVYFQHGFLFFVEKEGQSVAAGLCCPHKKNLNFVIVGVLNGDKSLMKERVLGILNVLRIQWANQQGFEAVNLQGCAPLLQGGQLQYKRKWGGQMLVPTSERKRIYLKVRRMTPAVSQFLKDNPAIIIDEKRALHGFIVTDDLAQVSAEDRTEWQKKYATPGLENLLVYTVADLVDDSLPKTVSGPVSIWNPQTNPGITP